MASRSLFLKNSEAINSLRGGPRPLRDWNGFAQPQPSVAAATNRRHIPRSDRSQNGGNMKIDRVRGVLRFAWVLSAAVTASCGDAESSDHRGYTKAPLEHAGVIIRAEKPTAMDELGTPILPVAKVITAEEVAAPKK
jgi:hypothetical protein